MGLYVCGRHCFGGGFRDGAADYVGGGSSICDEVEGEVQHTIVGKRESNELENWRGCNGGGRRI